MTTDPAESPRKEGRIARDVRMALAIGRQPKAILPVLRAWLIKLWASRGGGLYGLGYVVSFAALEARSLAGDFSSVSGVVAQAVQYVIRFSVESFLNGIRALMWPVTLFQWLGGLYGVAVLALGYLVFEHALRPVVEAQFPELKEAAAERERRRQEKKERKRSKRAQ